MPISHWRMTVAYVSRDFKGAVPSGDNFEPFYLNLIFSSYFIKKTHDELSSSNKVSVFSAFRKLKKIFFRMTNLTLKYFVVKARGEVARLILKGSAG